MGKAENRWHRGKELERLRKKREQQRDGSSRRFSNKKEQGVKTQWNIGEGRFSECKLRTKSQERSH